MRRSKLAVICTLASFTAGCGVHRDQEAAASFSKSASAFAATLKTAYTQAPQDEADLRAARYIIAPGLRPNGSTNYEKPRALGGFDITMVKGRLAAAEALSSYGQALATLLDVQTQETDIAAATGKLAAALKNVPQSYLADASITAADIDNAGKVLTVFIDVYLNYRRREVLALVVPAMEPIVAELCTKFERDFDWRQSGFANTYYIFADRVMDSAMIVETDNDFQHRAIVQPIFQKADSIRTKMSVTYESVKDAAKSCIKSNLALRKAVEDPTISFEDLGDFANKAGIAYTAVHTLIVSK